MSAGLPTYCVDCGTMLLKDNPTDVCAECRWERRDARLRAMEREHERQRRRKAVAERLAQLSENDGPS
jgi:hypothetical protein